ncbi:hypothetical protein [uncultured Sunxiuqinia sp.]|uniref:hypothetical protein n=1 Tax=uncultured Sunxiuqinia sp. TaxID=1573825 RepID=UPI002AA765D6|nr:hypothetical protein [uncultured Sunxiuqinia sp.]
MHSLDGYDEISLTSNAQVISSQEEKILSPADFGFDTYAQEELSGGKSVEDAAFIFKSILKGKGTPAQQHVGIANAALGIKCMCPDKSLPDCVAEATEALKSKKALAVFTKLMTN